MGNSKPQHDVQVLWHKAWLLLLAALLASGATFLLCRLSTPVYQASAILLVDETPSGKVLDYSAIVTSERLALTYSALLTTRPLLREVISSLNLSLSERELARAIAVAMLPNTQLIELQVVHTNPELAANIANLLPAIFSKNKSAAQANRYLDSKNSLKKELDLLQEQITHNQSEIDFIRSPNGISRRSELQRLEPEMTQMRLSAATLFQSYEAVRLAEAQSVSNIVIADPATVPSVPIRPRTLLNTLVAGILGFLLSAGLLLVVYHLDDRIRLPEQIEEALNLPVIGLIPHWKGDREGVRQRTTLISISQPRSPTVEAFRALRTNISFSAIDKPIRTLLVTSAAPGEGKSSVSANLSVVMTVTGLRVALLDGDLRRPTASKLISQESSPLGLTTLLLQDPHQWPKTQQTQIPNLTVIGSGPPPPNPSELLGSSRMQQLVAFIGESHDMIVIDSPPLLPVTDALVLSRLADGVLLVVHTGFTKIAEVVRAKQLLERSGAKILGVVMNRIPSKGPGAYDHQYSTYQYDEPQIQSDWRSRLGRIGVAWRNATRP